MKLIMLLIVLLAESINALWIFIEKRHNDTMRNGTNKISQVVAGNAVKPFSARIHLGLCKILRR